MPFGLVNAPATFNRLMRKLLHGMNEVDNFIDDILISTDTWEDHLEVLTELFVRLQNAGLTARPSKCFFAFSELECLGHIIGQQRLRPEEDKIESLKNAPIPETKKQVRSFLGLAGFYRKFIPNFSVIAIPLTNLTKKGQPNKVKWTESTQQAFDTLKDLLCKRLSLNCQILIAHLSYAQMLQKMELEPYSFSWKMMRNFLWHMRAENCKIGNDPMQ